MNDLEEKIIVVEACGWKFVKGELRGTWPHWEKDGQWHAAPGQLYDTIDSIRKAVLMQDDEFQEAFDAKLRKSWMRSKLIHQLAPARLAQGVC
jgi:hypothetical protein